MDATIICPNCSTEVKLTESLAAPILNAARQEFDKKIAAKDAHIAARETDLKTRQEALLQAQASLDEQVAAKLQNERTAIVAEEARKAKLAIGNDLQEKTKQLTEMAEILAQRDLKLAQAQKEQAELMRKQRELDDAKREMDVTIEKQVQASLATVREKAKLEAEEGLKLKVSEKEIQIASMQQQIEELRRRSEQGSQQLQGEALELELEALLASRFPGDILEPVAKGEFGGDVLHRVIGPGGQACGAILWESKRTKNWSDGWLPKLRNDQRAAKAEMALLISEALPKGVETFDYIDNVWVALPRFAVPIALMLRHSLIEVANARISGEGQQTKMEMVYQYLTGPRFRHRIEAIVERFSEMQDDLNRERKAMTRLWAKREIQIQGVVESTVGLYGDLQGIAGRAMQEIEGLSISLLDGPSGE